MLLLPVVPSFRATMNGTSSPGLTWTLIPHKFRASNGSNPDPSATPTELPGSSRRFAIGDTTDAHRRRWCSPATT